MTSLASAAPSSRRSHHLTSPSSLPSLSESQLFTDDSTVHDIAATDLSLTTTISAQTKDSIARNAFTAAAAPEPDEPKPRSDVSTILATQQLAVSAGTVDDADDAYIQLLRDDDSESFHAGTAGSELAPRAHTEPECDIQTIELAMLLTNKTVLDSIAALKIVSSSRPCIAYLFLFQGEIRPAMR